MLTVRQPWAWAIIKGGKDVENRSWPTKYRGPLFIHAGSAFERDAYERVRGLASQAPPPPGDFIHGAIIGVVELADCVPSSPSVWAVLDQWHWCLREPREMTAPFRCPGKLGLWRPPPGLEW